MSGHTSGPWWIGENENFTKAILADAGRPKGLVIAFPVAGREFGPGEADDNARLLAAAPDLLEALRAVWKVINKRGIHGPGCAIYPKPIPRHPFSDHTEEPDYTQPAPCDCVQRDLANQSNAAFEKAEAKP